MTPRDLALKIDGIVYDSELTLRSRARRAIESLLTEALAEAYAEGGAIDNVVFHKPSALEGKKEAYEDAAKMFEGAGDTLFTANQIVDLIRRRAEELK